MLLTIVLLHNMIPQLLRGMPSLEDWPRSEHLLFITAVVCACCSMHSPVLYWGLTCLLALPQRILHMLQQVIE